MQPSLSYEPAATYLCQEFNLKKVNGTTGQTDNPVITRIGDETAFEQIFRQFHPALCRYALTILKDTDAAEEVVQEVFLKVWEKRESLLFTVSVKSYLYRAVHNSCLNLLEKKKKEVRMDEAPLKIVHQPAPATADLQSRELEKSIAAALDKLPEQCRKVFEMSRFGELKYSEIAGVLGISVKTVENQMGKALRIMREQLSPYLHLLLPFFLYQLTQFIPVL